MSKVNLAGLANLQNETTAVNQINSNSSYIENGFDNTLSRDGTAPNQMNAELDMNSNHIINLPAPGSSEEPVRLGDLTSLSIAGLLAIPTGTLLGNYSGVSQIPTPQYFSLSDTSQFDTRAAVASQVISGTVSRIKVAHYATGYPLYNTVYVQGSSSGPGAIQSLNGIWWNIDLSTGSLAAESFGAKGDFSADDVPAIQAAVDALNTAGGGNLTPLPNRTYQLGSLPLSGNGLSAISLRSRVNIIGDGSATYKLKAGINTALQFVFPFYSDDPNLLNDVTYSGFTIDFNGSLNTGGNANNLSIGIGAKTGDNIIVDKIKIINNPGSVNIGFGKNVVTPAVTNLRITNCCFENSGDAVNSGCLDHSSINVNASNCVIAYNVMSLGGHTSSTGVEIHGNNVLAIGNTITDYSGGFNVANELQSPGYNLSVIGNSINNVKYGVGVFARTLQDLGGIVIANNTIALTPADASVGVDAASFVDSGSNALNISITNNIITSYGMTPSSTSTNTGILIGGFSSVNCAGNQVYNSQGPGIWRTNVCRANSIININDNLLYNPGLGTVNPALYSVGVKVDSDSNVPAVLNIQGNSVIGSFRYGILGSLNVANGQINRNTFVSAITANISYTGTGMSTGVTSTTTATTSNFTTVNGMVTRI